MVVAYDVLVAEGREDLEFGVELLALLLRHLEVANFLAAHDEAVLLPSHLPDDAKGAMAYVCFCQLGALRGSCRAL